MDYYLYTHIPNGTIALDISDIKLFYYIIGWHFNVGCTPWAIKKVPFLFLW